LQNKIPQRIPPIKIAFEQEREGGMIRNDRVSVL
jgi:hypothetical protein